MAKRVSIYIDGANFVYGLKTLNQNYTIKGDDINLAFISFDEIASINLINEADKFIFINKKTANRFFWRENKKKKVEKKIEKFLSHKKESTCQLNSAQQD